MRLDKFIAENTGLTRSQATKAIRQSAVKIKVKNKKNFLIIWNFFDLHRKI